MPVRSFHDFKTSYSYSILRPIIFIYTIRMTKNTLVVLDFDGFMINSYELLKSTLEQFWS